MPIYEYHCGHCDLYFEITRPMSQATKEAPCRKCGKESTQVLSIFSSKQGYSIKGAEKEAFRRSKNKT